MEKKTDFGFKEVLEGEKPSLVRDLFSRVAPQYDRMNDLMSFGLHRLWKRSFIREIPKKSGLHLLDVAGGTGDIALQFLSQNRSLHPEVTVCDPTLQMMEAGQGKAMDQNILKGIHWVEGSAESLPFEDDTFDAYTISFGLRNVTQKEEALREAHRVLKPGAPFLCLEFSKMEGPLTPAYNFYAMKLIPLLGKVVSDNKEAYRYLSESIERFPGPETLRSMVEEAGFLRTSYTTMTSGLVAIHRGWKGDSHA